MTLKKTTILPTDSAAYAARLFRDWVQNEPYVLFVAQGTDSLIEQMVNRADKLAGVPSDPRWVIWARRPEDIQAVIEELSGPEALKAAIHGARGFSVGLGDDVRDVIRADEPEPNMVRILKAFVRAEASRNV